MSANFSLPAADVVITNDSIEDPEELEAVQITVRNGRARLETAHGELLQTKDGVVLSRRIERTHWSVTFSDSTVWDVRRSKKGCKPCGG